METVYSIQEETIQELKADLKAAREEIDRLKTAIRFVPVHAQRIIKLCEREGG